MPLATPGNVPHIMGNQAANRVEGGICIGTGQPHAKSLIHTLHRRVAADPVGPVSKRKNVTLICGNVEFVLDLADDLLEDVFNR